MIGAFVLGVVLAATSPATSEPRETDPFPEVAASYLVAIDGRVLWSHEPDTPRLPASLTKIMTALVLLEGKWSAEAPVVVSRRAAQATGSRAGLQAGETLRAGDLMTAMLVTSANDACVALAEHAAGSERAFVLEMNKRAEAMGLSKTRFENACGHDAPGHRSSARDLLALAEAALAHTEFARIVALPSADLETAGGRRFHVETGNHLLGSLRGARGVKTGFTSGAGKCVIALAERDGKRVVVVLLAAHDRWWAAAALIEEAFDPVRTRR